MGAARDTLMPDTMVRMPDGSYLPASTIQGMSAQQVADLYKQQSGFGGTLGSTGIQSSQEMFDEVRQQALADEWMANIIENQGVPSTVSGQEYFDKMTDTLKSLGLDPQEYAKLDNGLLDTGLGGLGGDETIVTDDPQTEWDKLDKTMDFQDLLGKAMDIFGAYNRDAIKNVVDVVNDREMSVYEVAGATGNTVESINQAAAESGATINNQEAPSVLTGGEASVGSGDTVIDQTPDLRGTGTPTGRVIGDGVTPEPKPVVTDEVTPTVTDVVTTPSVPTTPTTPTTPKTNITLMQSIVNDTPITESILFEPKFTTLDNIPQGLFGRIYRAAGGR